MKNQSFQKWEEFYLENERTEGNQLWPSENLVRMFKGKYIDGLTKKYTNKKVIDIVLEVVII